MAQRAVVFLVTVLIALGVGVFSRRGEQEAAAKYTFWPGLAELRAQDLLLRARPAPPARRDVVIVAVDAASLKRYGKLPWNRVVWATGLRRLQQARAKTVVFDVALDRRTKEVDDKTLWRMMASGRRTILGLNYNSSKTRAWTPDDVRALRVLEKFAIADKAVLPGAAATQLFPWPLFEAPVSNFGGAARGAGVFVRETDADGIVRHARLLFRSRVETPTRLTAPLPGRFPASKLNGFEVVVPSLALSGALHALGQNKTGVGLADNEARLSARASEPPVVIPLDSAGRMTISYAGEAGTIRQVSFADLTSGRVSGALFRNAIVVLGVTAKGAKETDTRATPLGAMPRVEITASAIGSILGRSFLARARGNDYLATLIVVGVVAGLALAGRRPGAVIVAGLVLAGLYLLTAWGLLLFANVLAPILPALLVLGLATLAALICMFVFKTA